MQAGLYEQLLTLALQQDLEGLADPRLYTVAPVDAEDAHAAICAVLGTHARRRARDVSWFGSGGSPEAVDRSDGCHADGGVGAGLGSSTQYLDTAPAAACRSRGTAESIMDRPDTPLSRSALLTGTRLDPSLGSQLRKEIATADRVDILCSFIRWSGLRILLDDLRQLAEQR